LFARLGNGLIHKKKEKDVHRCIYELRLRKNRNAVIAHKWLWGETPGRMI
jgi:hypothetical protein